MKKELKHTQLFSDFLNEGATLKNKNETEKTKSSTLKLILSRINSEEYLKMTGWWGFASEEQMENTSDMSNNYKKKKLDNKSLKFFSIEGRSTEGNGTIQDSLYDWECKFEIKEDGTIRVMLIDGDGSDQIKNILTEILKISTQ